MTNKGVGANIALSCSQGIFGGISIEGAFLNPRPRVNEKFYGQKLTPAEILQGAVQVPAGNHLLPEVYDKLDKLCNGISIYEGSETERTKSDSFVQEADGEAYLTVNEETIVLVDVKGSNRLLKSNTMQYFNDTEVTSSLPTQFLEDSAIVEPRRTRREGNQARVG